MWQTLRVSWGRLRLRSRLRRYLPPEVAALLRRLREAGIEAWLVGGCVRDLLLNRIPRDWDVAAAASGTAIEAAVGRTVAARQGTVIVPLGPGLAVEVTTLRGQDLQADLGRRDFTIGAMALTPDGRLHDPFGGRHDLAGRLVRATADPAPRFDEDPARLLRAVRLAAELQGRIDPDTRAAIAPRADRLQSVSPERLRDELVKSLLSPWPAWALEEMRLLGLLRQVIPELEEGAGVHQNQYHAFDVWEHAVLAVAAAPPVLHIRLAALLHDIAKPRCLSTDADGNRHFYNHETVGAEMADRILQRLRFDSETRRRTVHLVRYHMDLHLDLAMSDQAILRMVRRIGRENLTDLVTLRRADRMASGTKPGELGAGTLFLLRRIEELEHQEQAFTTADLAVNGNDVMEALGTGQGPAVGEALERLLGAVQEGQVQNERAPLLAWLREHAR